MGLDSRSGRGARVLRCAAATMLMTGVSRPAEAVQITSIFQQVTSAISGGNPGDVTELSPNSFGLPTTSGNYFNQAHKVQTNPEGSSVSAIGTMDLNYDFSQGGVVITGSGSAVVERDITPGGTLGNGAAYYSLHIEFTPDPGEQVEMIATTQFISDNVGSNPALYGMRLLQQYHGESQVDTIWESLNNGSFVDHENILLGDYADYTFELSELVVNEVQTGTSRAGFENFNLTITPEPGAATLGLLGAAGMIALMSRRRARHRAVLGE